MNRQNLEKKEVRLGMTQLVGVLGLTIGSIIAAFCLGFYSGRSIAFERELSNALASLPKLPVNAEQADEDIGDKIVSEVYAKLNEQAEEPAAVPTVSAKNEATNFPELGTIQEDTALPEEIEEDTEVMVDEQLNVAPTKGKKEEKNLAALFDEDSKDMDSEPSAAIVAPVGTQKGKTVVEETTAKTEAKIDNKAEMLKKEKELKDKELKEKELKEKELKEKELKAKEKELKELAKLEQVKEEKLLAEKTALPKSASTIKAGWYAQIAAPKMVADANEMAANLRKSGFSSVIETADVRGEKYYRVLVGPEGSKSQGEVLLKQLKREPYIKSDPFLKVVK